MLCRQRLLPVICELAQAEETDWKRIVLSMDALMQTAHLPSCH